MHNSVDNLITIKNQLKQINSNTEIIAVSKSFISSKIMPLIEYGHIHYGENKVQEAQNKWKEILPNFKNIKLHMIGKLQTNKVKQAINLFDYIHSVDSIKLAQKISIEQKKINKKLKIFIQINIGKEKQKNGILEEDLLDFHQYLVNDLKIDVIGLMCIPPIEAESAKVFEKMKNLNQKVGLKNLSMGMSSDYLDAAKNGSTHVRVGSKIFGLRN
jgi:pyridoxal phosphate enzyme (YggS family)